MHPLLHFPLTSVPSGATITSVSLIFDVDIRINVAGATATVRRMTRSWCLQANQCYDLCQNKLVEGRLNGNEPDQFSEGYGTVWNYYYYNKNSVACGWTGGSVLNDIGAQYGSFSSGTTGAKSADITSLVQGWYGNTIPVRGVSLELTGGGNNIAAIASREATTAANRPYIWVKYTLGVGTNLSIVARPLLSCEGGQIVVNMTANVSAFQSSIVAPTNLNVDAFNNTITKVSGPTPASYANVTAGKNVSFTYVYSVVTGGYPGTVCFSGRPTTPSSFATAYSNCLITTPRLYYTVKINATTPHSENWINNTANFFDENVFKLPAGAVSNEVSTNIIWPANIQVTKSANITQGVKCNKTLFTLVVKNTGIAPLKTVEVTDTLPLGMSYVSSLNGTPNGQVITWSNIGPLVENQVKTLTFVAHINGLAFGFNNTVRSRAPQDGRQVTNSSFKLVQALKTGVSGSKTADITQGPPSTNINFTLVIKNTGESPLSLAWLLDMLLKA